MAAIRADLAARGPVRSVVVAHAFVAGAVPSDSERELAVGGVDRVPTSVFDGVGYTALGHLHRAQAVGERAAYSGSLLPYSFAETAPPSMRLVTLTPDGHVEAETVPLGVERGVATVEGRLDVLLADPAHAAVESRWLRVRLTDEALPRHAMARVRDRFPHAVVLEHVHATAASAPADRRTGDERVTPLDLASEFLAERLGRAVTEPEATLLRAAFDEVEARRREVEVTVVGEGVAPARAGDDLGSGAVA
jgi:exonuclease SbcD